MNAFLEAALPYAVVGTWVVVGVVALVRHGREWVANLREEWTR